MDKRVTSFFCSCALLLVLIGRSASVPSSNLLGIAPQDDVYYKALFSSPSSTIKCKDGSKKFTKSQFNDDFCDCPDGTDEPGTSACPGGTFYCRNAGHSPLAIFSSRVNDGICDCCDGSDEYDGKVNCSNTCWEAGKVARDKLKKKISTFREGATLRKQEVEKAKVAIVKDEAELSRLQNEEKILKGLVQQLRERKEQIEKAEEEERLNKEKEEKEKKEASEAQSKTAEEAVSQENPIESNEDKIVEASSSDQDMGEISKNSINEVEHTDIDNSPTEGLPENEGSTKKEEESPAADESRPGTVTKEEDGSENPETLSKEELGRLVASRWTGESTGQEAREVDAVRDDKNEKSGEESTDAHDENSEVYDSEIEDDRPSYNEEDDEGNHSEDFEEETHEDSSSSFKSMSDDELDLSDITTSSNPSWLEKIQNTVKNILQAVKLFQTPVDLSEAAHVRKEYDDSSAKLSKIQSRISSLTEKLKHDFGPEKEFYSFYGKCFEIKQNKYVYKICPFKQASQEEGYSRTGLGNWDKFEDSYNVMMFSGGDKCWNGPDRSLKVKLRCGLKNEVTDVGEPSRCEYEALLATPALCQEQKLKELEAKLDLMNSEEPKGHDEL